MLSVASLSFFKNQGHFFSGMIGFINIKGQVVISATQDGWPAEVFNIRRPGIGQKGEENEVAAVAQILGFRV